MTLIVNAYYYDKKERVTLKLSSDSVANDLAGPESYRTQLYGSDMSLKLGVTLLCKLAKQAVLLVEGSELDTLERDVELLKGTLNKADNTDSYAFRLNNILVAITMARQYGKDSGVYIG